MNLLFTGGGGAGNGAIWHILSTKYNIYFADAQINAIDSTIPESRRVSIPFAFEQKFVSVLQEISDKLSIDYLIPGVDEELLILANSKLDFSSSIFIPSFDFIKLMLNKYDCANAIINKGLIAPKTRMISKVDELDFPLVVKPKSGRGSRGVMIVNSQKELDAYRVLYNTKDKDLIVQELILGQEYTVLVSANITGELNSIIPVKVDQKKGITIRARIEMNKAIIHYAKKFHKQFRTKGIYNIQCILTDNKEVFPFEVNPRVSTTFCLSLAAGLNPFEMYLKSNPKEDLFVPASELCLQRNWFNNIFECIG